MVTIYFNWSRDDKERREYWTKCPNQGRVEEMMAFFDAPIPRGHGVNKCTCKICRAPRWEYPL